VAVTPVMVVREGQFSPFSSLSMFCLADLAIHWCRLSENIRNIVLNLIAPQYFIILSPSERCCFNFPFFRFRLYFLSANYYRSTIQINWQRQSGRHARVRGSAAGRHRTS
jgi:hypothetical protein